MSTRPHLIHKIKARDTTQQCANYFVYVPPDKERGFPSALKSKELTDLTEGGEVLASCYGEQPNEEVKRLLKDGRVTS